MYTSTDNIVTTYGMQSRFDLAAIFAFSQVVKEWAKNVKVKSAQADPSATPSDQQEAQDTSLIWLIENLPDYTNYWTKSSRYKVGQLRLTGNDDVRKLILKLTMNFWRETETVLAKHNIVQKFISEASVVTYPLELYEMSKDAPVGQDKIKYLAEMSTYPSLSEDMKKDAEFIPELVPLFYFALFVNQVMEETQL